MILSASLSGPESSTVLSICSAALTESKSQNQCFKQEAIIQSFQLPFGEELLHFSSAELFQTSDVSNNGLDNINDKPSKKVKNSPFRKLICVTKNEKGEEERTVVESCSSSSSNSSSNKQFKTKDLQPNSSPISVFEQKTVDSLESIKTNYSEILGARNVYIFVTNKNIYMLQMVQDPIDIFLSCVMQGRIRDSDTPQTPTFF